MRPLDLLAEDPDEAVRLATDRLSRFSALFDAAHLRVLRAKLGLTREDPDDRSLSRLAQNHVDYTLFFRRLCATPTPSAPGPRPGAVVSAAIHSPLLPAPTR